MEVIKRNFQDFCDRSGKDTETFMEVWGSTKHKGVWLGGGSVRRTLMGVVVDSDYDYFFKDAGTLESWESALPSSFKKVRETAHHNEYHGKIESSDLPIVLQAIKFKYYDDVEQVLDSFDYTITQFTFDGENLHTTPEALWDLGRKRLVLHRVTYPVATMRRMLKYTNQGFTACAGCMTDLYRLTMDNPDALAQMDIAYVD